MALCIYPKGNAFCSGERLDTGRVSHTLGTQWRSLKFVRRALSRRLAKPCSQTRRIFPELWENSESHRRAWEKIAAVSSGPRCWLTKVRASAIHREPRHVGKLFSLFA